MIARTTLSTPAARRRMAASRAPIAAPRRPGEIRKVHRSIAVEVLPKPMSVRGETTKPMSTAASMGMKTVHMATDSIR